MLQLQTPIYFIFSVGLYGVALYYFYKNHIENFRNQEKSKSSKGTGGVKVAAIAAGSGQLIANIILSIATQQMGQLYLCVHAQCFRLFCFI